MCTVARRPPGERGDEPGSEQRGSVGRSEVARAAILGLEHPEVPVVSGPMRGARLRPLPHDEQFWFALAAFGPHARLLTRGG